MLCAASCMCSVWLCVWMDVCVCVYGSRARHCQWNPDSQRNLLPNWRLTCVIFVSLCVVSVFCHTHTCSLYLKGMLLFTRPPRRRLYCFCLLFWDFYTPWFHIQLAYVSLTSSGRIQRAPASLMDMIGQPGHTSVQGIGSHYTLNCHSLFEFSLHCFLLWESLCFCQTCHQLTFCWHAC